MALLDDYLAGLRMQYPGYVLLIKQGRWYSVYDRDADVMHRILNWNVVPWSGHQKTAGPVLDNITNALMKNGYAYKIINGATVIGSYDPPDPKPALTAAKALPDDVVHIGSIVAIKIDGDEKTFEIGEEGNIAKKILSYESPIGKALLGHKVGDVVIADTPNGDLSIEIVNFV